MLGFCLVIEVLKFWACGFSIVVGPLCMLLATCLVEVLKFGRTGFYSGWGFFFVSFFVLLI
jgi:hypothetical protein